MSVRPCAVVTGGAGFIGSHMVDLLASKGFTLRVIDNLSGGREANLGAQADNPQVALDRRDIRTIEPHDALFRGADYVFHFAGIGDIVPSINKPTEYMDVNVMGTVRMLEGARNAGVRKFVYAASSSCYGVCRELPTSESAAIQPMYPYALSKYLGEQAVFHWAQVYGLPVNSIRIFNAYGPRSRTTGAYGAVFGVFLKQKLAGRPFTVVGDGSQTRDFIYVSDLVRAFFAAATADRSGQVYNVGASKPQSVSHLVELLQGYGVEYLPKRPGEPDCTWADISKAKRELGWQPQVSFQEGVSELLKCIENWRDAPLWDKQSITAATAEWFAALGK